MFALRILATRRLRFALAVVGVALSALLVLLFLAACPVVNGRAGAPVLPCLLTAAGLVALDLLGAFRLLPRTVLLAGRSDLAVLRTLGAPWGFLPRLVMSQALWIAGCGCALAVAALLPLILAIEAAAPGVSLESSWLQVAAVVGATALLSLLGSWPVARRLARVHLSEVRAS